MKKWIGALCSALAGALSLVFLCIPAFVVDFSYAPEKYSGWKLLNTKDFNEIAEVAGKETLTALTWYRVFAWILVVLAIVLIVIALLQVLANLNVIKMPAIIDTVAKYALIALAVVAILALVANFGIRSEILDVAKDVVGEDGAKEMAKYYKIGASLWVVAGINLVAAVCANLFAKKAK